jgi:hypothetical protein
VRIFLVFNKEEIEVFSCKQQDLFKKKNWPAKDSLISAVRKAEECGMYSRKLQNNALQEALASITAASTDEE